jgi:hypothetical protein
MAASIPVAHEAARLTIVGGEKPAHQGAEGLTNACAADGVRSP